MYNAFISYRKSSPVNADWIRQSIVDKSVYSTENIFLDKHSIGPVLFDEKIKKAISESNCIILLVTDGCFKAKPKVEEDWYIKEIKAALSYGKRIIPVLFDGINSLSDPSIFDELNKVFTNEEVDILVKSQSIKYSDDYPDASITKLIQFVEEANATRSVFDRILLFVQGLGILLALLFLFIALCFSIGFAWGYFSSSPNNDSVLADNTTIDGDKLHFEYAGWNAIYDLGEDTIFVNLKDYNQKPRMGNVDLIMTSFTLTGAKFLLEKNLSYLKYVKFLKGGSKPARIAFLCASAAIFFGSLCGFSQGSNFGQLTRQEDAAKKLYPRLQQRPTWEAVLKGNISLKQKYDRWRLIKSPNCIAFGAPCDSFCVAYKAGITSPKVLLKYNDWEIGKGNYINLETLIETSQDKDKYLVFLNIEDLSVSEYHLPNGIVGIDFQPWDGNQGRYEIAVAKFKEWACQQKPIPFLP